MSVIIIVLFIALIFSENAYCESESKIVNGIIADRENFPYQAAILMKQKGQKELFLCGGSIIDSRAVLTAAHCMWNVEKGIVILGALDLLANETHTSRFIVSEKDFKPHPNFNLHYAFMDVALIILPEAIIFTKYIQPVALPSKFLFDESFAGDMGLVAGYGRFCDSCGSSSVLRYAKNRIISTDECSSYVGLFPSPTQVCVSTAENKSSACRGDSGGALTVVRNNLTIQIGISSFGAEKCEDGRPAVFTRLTKDIVEWIEGEVKKANE